MAPIRQPRLSVSELPAAVRNHILEYTDLARAHRIRAWAADIPACSAMRRPSGRADLVQSSLLTGEAPAGGFPLIVLHGGPGLDQYFR